MAKFGELLSELRKDRNMTQRDLAQVLYVTTGTISNYDNGAHFPDVEKLIDISEFFGVTTDYLLGRTSYSYSLDVLNKQLANGMSVGDLVDMVANMNEERLKALTVIIKDMNFTMMIDAHSGKSKP